MELIAVVLKGSQSQQRFEDAKTMLNYGFATYALHTVEPTQPLPTMAVQLGMQDTVPLQDKETVLLIDSWESRQALDVHHASPMMQTIAALRDKYDLHMRVERYVSDDETTQGDKFIRK